MRGLACPMGASARKAAWRGAGAGAALAWRWPPAQRCPGCQGGAASTPASTTRAAGSRRTGRSRMQWREQQRAQQGRLAAHRAAAHADRRGAAASGSRERKAHRPRRAGRRRAARPQPAGALPERGRAPQGARSGAGHRAPGHQGHRAAPAELAAERKPLLDEAEFYKGKPLPPKLKAQIDANDAAVEAQRGGANQEAELDRINRSTTPSWTACASCGPARRLSGAAAANARPRPSRADRAPGFSGQRRVQGLGQRASATPASAKTRFARSSSPAWPGWPCPCWPS
jgi:hypothetical protein